MLSQCLASIYRNVPVNRLIVIDGYSNDKTIQILEACNQKHGNVKVVQAHGSRAKARTLGINQVTTDQFMFVDSDVVLSDGWYGAAQTELTGDVGAVWGLNIDVIPNIMDKSLLRFQIMIARECFKLRGGMHDTLLLRKAVEDIKIPEHLHIYEDAYIIEYMKRKGYSARIGSQIYCQHKKPPNNWSIRNGFKQGILDIKCGLVYSHLYHYMFFYPTFLFYWCLQVPFNGFAT